jgi:hypothetical protein
MGFGEFSRAVVVPSPSCPTWFLPQQEADPLSKIAHVFMFDASTATAVLPTPKLTYEGVKTEELGEFVPMPIWP